MLKILQKKSKLLGIQNFLTNLPGALSNKMLPAIYLTIYQLRVSFPCDSASNKSTCNVGDLGLISGLGISPGEGKGYPLQYSGPENSMDCIVHGVAELGTTEWLLLFTFTIVPCLILTVASWPAYRFHRSQGRWSGIHISWRIFHSLFWSTWRI